MNNIKMEESILTVKLDPGVPTGCILDSFGDKVIVSKVEKGSPAEKAGITVGLKVVSINNKETGDWTLDQVRKEIENSNKAVHLRLSSNTFDMNSLHPLSSQRSSRNLGTDDEASQSTGSQSSVIDVSSAIQNLSFKSDKQESLIASKILSRDSRGLTSSPVEQSGNDGARTTINDQTDFNSSTFIRKSKNVTYTVDTSLGNENKNVSINTVNDSDTANADKAHLNEITSTYWPAGTLITVEQRQEMDLLRKKQEEDKNEDLYSKVIHKPKVDDVNTVKNTNVTMPITLAKSSHKSESVYNEIKLPANGQTSLSNSHEVKKEAKDSVEDVSVSLNAIALNTDGRRRSRSVPGAEPQIEVAKESSATLTRKASSVDRKLSNEDHPNLGKSFFSRLFGSQKKIKDTKRTKKSENTTKSAQNITYESLSKENSKKDTSTEKHINANHAETYIVVERSKKINRLQSRDSMTSMDEPTSCMRSCVCLGAKSRRKSCTNIVNQSPEFQLKTGSVSMNNKDIDIQKDNHDIILNSCSEVEVNNTDLQVPNAKIKSIIDINKNINGSSEIIIENALHEQLSADKFKDNTEQKFNFDVNKEVTVKNTNLNLSKSIDLKIKPVIKQDITLDSNNINKSTSVVTTQPVIKSKIDTSSFQNNTIVLQQNNRESTLEKPSLITTNYNINKTANTSIAPNVILEAKKPSVSAKPVTQPPCYSEAIKNDQNDSEYTKVVKNVQNFNVKNTVEVSSSNIPKTEKSIVNFKTIEVEKPTLNIKKEEIVLQKVNDNGIYDNTDSALKNNIDISLNNNYFSENDYDTIQISNQHSPSNIANNSYNKSSSVFNQFNNKIPFNSYTLPSLKIKNDNDNKLVSINNKNSHSQSPIYDLPLFNNETQQFSSHYDSSKYDNIHRRKHNTISTFEQSQVNNTHLINMNSKNNEIKYQEGDDNVFNNPVENIYEKIRLTPELIRKDMNGSLNCDKNQAYQESKKYENMQQNQFSKPLKNLNDLILPVYTRVNPNLSHEVVKPEPIKPRHLNLNKISYSRPEKKEPPKNVDDILNELLSSEEVSVNLSQHKNNTELPRPLFNDNKQTSQTNIYINNNQQNRNFRVLPDNDINLQTISTNVHNNNLSKENQLNRDINTNKMVNNDSKTVKSNEINNDSKFNQIEHNTSFRLLQFDSQAVNNHSIVHSKGENTANISYNTENDFNASNKYNIDKELSLIHKQNIERKVNANSFKSTKENCLINNNTGTRNNSGLVQNDVNDMNNRLNSNRNNIDLNRTNLPNNQTNVQNNRNNIDANINPLDVPDVVVTGPSPFSTLNYKIQKNETMVDKQKNKLEIERILAVERQRKLAQEKKENEFRRHSDNYSPLEKASIILNRYEKNCYMSHPDIPAKTRLTKYRGKAKVLYNFRAQRPRELSLRKGDLVYIVSQVDENWYKGEHHGHQGIFPIIYVEVIESLDTALSKAKVREGTAQVIFDFQAQTPIELSLQKGAKITLIRRVDANWYEGKYLGKQGIFPSSYVGVDKEPETPLCTPAPTPLTSRNTTPMPGWMSPTPSILSGAPSIPSAPTSPLSFLSSPHMYSPMSRSMASPLNFSPNNFSPARYGSRPPSECSGRDSMTPSFYKQYNVEGESRKVEIPSYGENRIKNEGTEFSMYRRSNSINVQHTKAERELPNYHRGSQSDALKFSSPTFDQSHASNFQNFDQSESSKYSNLTNSQSKGSRSSNSSLSDKGILMNQEAIYDITPHQKNKPSKQVTFPDLGKKSSHHEYERFLVLFDFHARDSDELGLRRGEMVRVLEKCSDGWYVGMREATGLIGSFPGNYVQLIKYTPPTNLK